MSVSVSVIVPVYNAENSLDRSLRSLTEQTSNNLEFIIVNDGSADFSKSIINRFASLDDRVTIVDFETNKGVHEARLAGLKVATGSWIGFLDADDIARPGMFEIMKIAGEKNGADIVICGSYRVDEKRKKIAPKYMVKKNQKIVDDIFKRFCFFEFGTGSLCNKLYRSEIIKPYASLHFPWRQSINEDLLLNIGCFYSADSVYLLTEVLHEYVYNKDSVTSNIGKDRAFVETFRAFALAILHYSKLGDEVLGDIINLYRSQLSRGGYQVYSAGSLGAYRQELIEAVDLIHNINPLSLSLLSARCKSAKLGFRAIALKAFDKWLS